MAWIVNAKCAACEFAFAAEVTSLPVHDPGGYPRTTTFQFRERMREHEVAAHGGKA